MRNTQKKYLIFKGRNIGRLLYITCLVVPCIAAGANYRYVTVDVANIRSKPSSGSTVIGKLHCSAYFTPADSVKDWYYIKNIPVQELYSNREYDDRSINGWIHTSLVSGKQVNLLDEFTHSKTLKDSLKWAERCYIANRHDYRRPYLDTLFIELLTDGYSKSGQKEKADYYKKIFSKTAPVYIAHTHNGQIRVIGQIDSAGDFHSLEVYACSDGSGRYKPYDDTINIDRLRLPLLSQKWISLHADYRSFYFTKSYIFPFDDPEKNGMFHYIKGDVEDCVNKGISFGKKDNITLYHNVFATRGIRPYADTLSTTKESHKRMYALTSALAKKDGCGFSSLSYRLLPYDMADITFKQATCSTCGAGEMKRAVFSKKDSAVAVVTYTFPVYNDDFSNSVNSWSWFAIDGIDGFYYTIQPYVEHHCSSEKGGAGCGILLFRVGPAGLKSYVIRGDQCGD